MSASDLHELAAGAPGKRLSVSQVAAALLEAQTRARAAGSSVTLTRNAKGNTQIEVVVRAGDSDLIQTAHDAELEAQAIYDRLCAAYAMLEESGKP